MDGKSAIPFLKAIRYVATQLEYAKKLVYGPIEKKQLKDRLEIWKEG